MTTKTTHIFKIFLFGLPLFLGACAGLEKTQEEDDLLTRREERDKNVGKLFGDNALLFGDTRKDEAGSTGIGVNSYLWRATLDTLSFMPLRHIDPFGGVILTEWYSKPESPTERLKVDVRILDRVLRADGLKISVFRQKMVNGHWRDASVSSETARRLEDSILTRARQIKIRDGR